MKTREELRLPWKYECSAVLDADWNLVTDGFWMMEDQMLHLVESANSYHDHVERIAELEAQNKRLLEALKFIERNSNISANIELSVEQILQTSAYVASKAITEVEGK